MTNPDVDPQVRDELIDQIVDGALTPAELQQALDRLDRAPDGWKRCTLAFLEVQCWRESFRELGATPAEVRSHSLVSRPVATRHTRTLWLRRAIAAAVTVAAFGLGWVAHRAGTARPLGPRRLEPANIAAVPADGTDSMAGESTVADLSATFRPEAVEPSQRVQLVGRLRLGAADVPILAGPGIDADWLNNQPPPLSAYGKAVLQERGYRVDERRQMIPATLADGRRVAVPVELGPDSVHGK